MHAVRNVRNIAARLRRPQKYINWSEMWFDATGVLVLLLLLLLYMFAGGGIVISKMTPFIVAPKSC